MLLEEQDDWFVIKDDSVLSNEKCFGDSFSNKNAFVEISKNEFNDMKKFLSEYKKLSENDFKPKNENENQNE